MDKIPTRENFGLLNKRLVKSEAKSGRKNEEGREERNEAKEDYNEKRVIKSSSAYLEGSDHGNPFSSLSSISKKAKKPYKRSTSSENRFSLSQPQFNSSIVTASQSIKNQSKLKDIHGLSPLKQQFALQKKEETSPKMTEEEYEAFIKQLNSEGPEDEERNELNKNILRLQGELDNKKK
jgi:hypothetical protein